MKEKKIIVWVMSFRYIKYILSKGLKKKSRDSHIFLHSKDICFYTCCVFRQEEYSSDPTFFSSLHLTYYMCWMMRLLLSLHFSFIIKISFFSSLSSPSSSSSSHIVLFKLHYFTLYLTERERELKFLINIWISN
jgi:hypothetical protein